MKTGIRVLLTTLLVLSTAAAMAPTVWAADQLVEVGWVEPGRLEALIDEEYGVDLDEITELIVYSGELNRADFQLIRLEMPNLVYLDLEEAYTEDSVLYDNAFRGHDRLETVILPLDTTVIDDRAFEDCVRLVDAEIPANVTEIGDSAFRGTAITEVTFPRSLTTVGDYAFEGCADLEDLVIQYTGGVVDLGTAVFSGTSLDRIRVPGDLVNAYKESTDWRRYSSIFSRAGTYALGVAAAPSSGGKVTGAPSSNVSPGRVVELTATPSSGYKFSRWEASGLTLSNPQSASIRFSMPARQVGLTAVFTRTDTVREQDKDKDKKNDERKVSVKTSPNAGGKVVGSYGNVREGKQVVLNAVPARGYRFVRWEVEGVSDTSIKNRQIKFKMPDKNVTVTAVFERRK